MKRLAWLLLVLTSCSADVDAGNAFEELNAAVCTWQEAARWHTLDGTADGCLLWRARDPFIVAPLGAPLCDAEQWRGSDLLPSTQAVVVFEPYGNDQPIDVWVGWADCDTGKPDGSGDLGVF